MDEMRAEIVRLPSSLQDERQRSEELNRRLTAFEGQTVLVTQLQQQVQQLEQAALDAVRRPAQTSQQGASPNDLIDEITGRVLDTSKLVKPPDKLMDRAGWSNFIFRLINYLSLIHTRVREEITGSVHEASYIDDIEQGSIGSGLRRRS